MLKSMVEYFEGNTSELNASFRSSEEIASRSLIKPANIMQLSK